MRSATAGRWPAPRPASPTASWTTGRGPAWSSRACGRARAQARSGSTASATSWCSKWSSGCWTPGSRCSRSGPRSTHLRAQGASDLAQVTLMSDGVSVYECTSADEVVDLLQGGQGVFGIALGRCWQEVEGTRRRAPRRARGRGRQDAPGARSGARRAVPPPGPQEPADTARRPPASP